MPPGFEMGPLGVPVMIDNYSGSRRGHKSPQKAADTAPLVGPSLTLDGLVSPHRPAGVKGGLLGDGAGPVPTAVDAGGVSPGVCAMPRRGSGLKELLGTEADGEKERERSRIQAEALNKQVEDNKVRSRERKAPLTEDTQEVDYKGGHKERLETQSCVETVSCRVISTILISQDFGRALFRLLSFFILPRRTYCVTQVRNTST